jgi:uncharacterized protein (DUF302 family)
MNGIINQKSRYGVRESLDRFQELLQAKGITVFARIDQQAEARKVALELRATELLVFGNPKAGTPIMSAFPLAALDLPLKLLAWEDSDAAVWLSYNAADYIQQRYALPDAMAKTIDFGPLVAQITI